MRSWLYCSHLVGSRFEAVLLPYKHKLKLLQDQFKTCLNPFKLGFKFHKSLTEVEYTRLFLINVVTQSKSYAFI